ncbi:MAG: sigma-70 family RNA polymerase sigma factor [Armatimonadota bacterium]|nr:sigma-70 family RNA polymerase sigma factor [Armatimonadota bacterium]
MAMTSRVAAQVRADETSLSPVAGGDSRAVTAFYRQHALDVYRFIARRVEGPVEDIEELLQDTMIAAVRSAGRFRGECSVRTWLCSIARNQIMQRQRTDLRKKRIPASRSVALEEADQECLQHVSVVEGPEDIGETLAAKEMVRQILEQLDPASREVLLLRYVDEFSVRDIAQIWNKSERSVEGLLRRARLRAREIGVQYL